MTTAAIPTQRISTATYPSSEMKIGSIKVYNNVYRQPETLIKIGISNGDFTTKQVIDFTGDDFENLLTEMEEGEPLWENCHRVLQYTDIQEAIEEGDLDWDEIEMAIKISNRVRFFN